MSNPEETVSPKLVTAVVIAALVVSPLLLLVSLVVPQRKPQ